MIITALNILLVAGLTVFILSLIPLVAISYYMVWDLFKNRDY